MRVLHTSDWHLGCTLYGRKRHAEYRAFLDWLLATITEQAVDVLLVSGDIFDTSTPGNGAQELYYGFLGRVAASPCRHVVVTAGNHDSPTFLDAPGSLLRALQVHVIGRMPDNVDDEVLLLRDAHGTPELVVCAVPFLRDRDIRTAEAGESTEDKERKMQEGIRRHYAEVAVCARTRREEAGGRVPVIGMGHLFTAGGQTVAGDGVRELYVGSLAHVGADIFADNFDYVALGHLHVPQKVGGRENVRYSGSPLPMGFGEARQQKSVCLVDFRDTSPEVRLIPVPSFQKLERIRGDWPHIEARLGELTATAGADAGAPLWLEIIYDGEAIVGDLRERLEAAIDGTTLEILKIQNNRIVERALAQGEGCESLDDLRPEDVFVRCLDAQQVADEQRPELLRTFGEALQSLLEPDREEQGERT